MKMGCGRHVAWHFIKNGRSRFLQSEDEGEHATQVVVPFTLRFLLL